MEWQGTRCTFYLEGIVGVIDNKIVEISNPEAKPFFAFRYQTSCRDGFIIYDGENTQYEVFCNIQSSQPNYTISDKYVLDYAIEEFALEMK